MSAVLVFAQESEQYLRLMKTLKSSSRAPERLRDMIAPQVTQGLGCSSTLRITQACSDIAVQPLGKPIKASTHVGFNEPGVGLLALRYDLGSLPPVRSATAFVLLATVVGNIRRSSGRCTARPSKPFVGTFAHPAAEPSFQSRAVGVGHDPDAIPPVRCANGGSGYAMPLRIIPERREAPEHRFQSARSKGTDVFGDDVARAEFADEPVELKPETRARPFEARAFTGEADVLAGEAAANDVDWSNAVLFKSCCIECPHVVIDWNVAPVFAKNRLGVGFSLAKSGGFDARPLETQREPADAREQVKASHRFAPIALIILSAD